MQLTDNYLINTVKLSLKLYYNFHSEREKKLVGEELLANTKEMFIYSLSLKDIK